MDVSLLLLAGLGLFIAGVVKGASGIGYSTAALPFLVLAVGLTPAMALVLAPAIASNLAVLIGTGGLAPVFVRFAPFYLATIPGIALGTAALSLVDVTIATRCLGIITLGYVALAMTKPALHLPAPLERIVAMPAGLLNGMLTGLTGSQIMPLMPFMMALGLRPAEQVQAINLAVTIASVGLAVAMVKADLATPHMLALSTIGVVPAVAGVTLGLRLRAAMSEAAFKRLTLYVLALVAASLLATAAPGRAPSCIDTTRQTAGPQSSQREICRMSSHKGVAA